MLAAPCFGGRWCIGAAIWKGNARHKGGRAKRPRRKNSHLDPDQWWTGMPGDEKPTGGKGSAFGGSRYVRCFLRIIRDCTSVRDSGTRVERQLGSREGRKDGTASDAPPPAAGFETGGTFSRREFSEEKFPAAAFAGSAQTTSSGAR